jgi:hypothetical protein
MALFIRVADESGAIYIDQNAFPYRTLEAQQYLPPSNDVAILDVNGGTILFRAEWDVFRDVNGNTFGADLSLSVTAMNTLFRYGQADPVTSVSVSIPLTSTGGTTPTIGIPEASSTDSGCLTSVDKILLDTLQPYAEPNVNADWNATNP